MDLHSIRKIVSYKKEYDSVFSSPHNEFGSYDNLPEDAFRFVGTIDEAVEKGKKMLAELGE